MRKIAFLLLIFCMFSCGTKETNFSLTGTVEGLKKGTLFLQKIEDTLVTNIDSIEVNGDSNFTLEAYLKEPEMLFLYLDKSEGEANDDIIEFFAEPGEMTLQTNLNYFAIDAKFEGSKNQEKYIAYKEIIKKFNNQHLDLLKENFDAQKENEQEKMIETNKKYENWLRRKYLYTVNYAIVNKNLEVAPYIAISEIFDANITYLDTIYNSLDKPIRKSKYGKSLKKLIKERKKINKLDKKVQKKD